MPPTPIILDCDPGHDDAIALLLALASPELDLLGVTTTFGNQTLGHGMLLGVRLRGPRSSRAVAAALRSCGPM
jgi:purine nucleosidase/pyrimidine-specific ribonucleoside hydrolase